LGELLPQTPLDSRPFTGTQQKSHCKSGFFINEAEGARTLNLRIDSPMVQNDKSCHSKELQQAGKGAYKPAYKNISEIAENKTQIDIRKLPTELADIVTVWHKLPEHIKAAVKALIQTHITEKK